VAVSIFGGFNFWQAGSQFTCNGTTSDGYTLKIVVSEREAGAFSWNIVESVPVS